MTSKSESAAAMRAKKKPKSAETTSRRLIESMPAAVDEIRNQMVTTLDRPDCLPLASSALSTKRRPDPNLPYVPPHAE